MLWDGVVNDCILLLTVVVLVYMTTFCILGCTSNKQNIRVLLSWEPSSAMVCQTPSKASLTKLGKCLVQSHALCMPNIFFSWVPNAIDTCTCSMDYVDKLSCGLWCHFSVPAELVKNVWHLTQS